MDRLRVTVLGVGNVLRRDDGVGVHVVEALRRRFRFPEGVRLVDGGLGGPALLGVVEAADALVAVDAVRGGQAPGTVYRIPAAELLRDPGGARGDGEGARVATPAAARSPWSLHEAGLLDLIALALGTNPWLRATIVGVEPLETREWGTELTPPVAARLPALLDLVLEELARLGVRWEEVAR